MKIMIFLHGTAIMHRSALGKTREERVRQVVEGEEDLHDFSSYVPTEGAVAKLRAWSRQGAQIVYLSSHRQARDAALDQAVLDRHGFPKGPIYLRGAGQTYAQVAEQIAPDVLVEDDCESIGGQMQMVFPRMQPEAQAGVKSIVVKEFGGLGQLADDLSSLAAL